MPISNAALRQRTEHRDFPPPNAPWVMVQRWHDLLFAHWTTDADALRETIPPGLDLDTFDGEAWVGVVPFHMTHVRPRALPHVPALSNFAELNVRTYVVRDGLPGVWFYSLDAANSVAVEIARATYNLPYFNANMAFEHDGDTVHYASQRFDHRAPVGEFLGSYRPAAPVRLAQPGSLEHWLTERYCLYAAGDDGRLYRGHIHHLPWSLQVAEADIRTETVASSMGVRLADMPPLLHFAKRLDILAWQIAAVE